jgi:hypothetical protein
MKVTGYSLAQTKRLIRQYVKTGVVSVKPARRNGFKRTYAEADIRLLASMDERRGPPAGLYLKSFANEPTIVLTSQNINACQVSPFLTCIT